MHLDQRDLDILRILSRDGRITKGDALKAAEAASKASVEGHVKVTTPSPKGAQVVAANE